MPPDPSPAAAALAAAAPAPAAPGTPTPGAPAPGAPAASNEPYFATWEPELKEVGTKFPGGPQEVARAYLNAQKLLGADKVAWPADGNPEGMKPIYKRLGVPDAPTGYDFKAGGEKDKPFVEWAAQTMLANNIPKSAGAGLFKAFNEYGQKVQADQIAQRDATWRTDAETLRGEWGAAFADRVAAKDIALHHFKLDDAKFDKLCEAWGLGAATRFMAELGKPLLESRIKTGDPASPGASAMTAEEAKAARLAKARDPDWMRKKDIPGTPERLEYETYQANEAGMSHAQWRAQVNRGPILS
jgi:hypothetical protein